MPQFTAVQRAALSFAALVRGGADWRGGIDRDRLSFTEFGQDPLTQLFGSFAAGVAKLHIAPGDSAGYGFAALDAGDAIELQAAWLDLLTTVPSWKELRS